MYETKHQWKAFSYIFSLSRYFVGTLFYTAKNKGHMTVKNCDSLLSLSHFIEFLNLTL